ncbi:hypothetical protein NDU88_000973 [Pleurodeles waltl]|uniref:Uncharacterized protein n=1 Tax=Pleurodeles waltl TaxID=8319 RepID=A0AAV7WH19_PLEWA|nr:hypothetical protein NDU88_000973 [Pleurodeles waltl]
MGEDELGGFIWLVSHFLPLMLEAGGRVIQGYHTEARKIRWEKVRHHLVRVYRSLRNIHQLKHRWADLISREQDLLDHLGLRIGGYVGGPAPYTVGEVAHFDDPDTYTANLSAAARNQFERRAMRYSHILQVQCGYRRMARRYNSERASGAWYATPQAPPTVPPTTPATTSTRSGQVDPARDQASSSRPGPSRVVGAGQSCAHTTPPTQSTSTGTQTCTDPPINPADFHALSRKLDRLIGKVDTLTEDMAEVKKKVRSIRRTLRRPNQ